MVVKRIKKLDDYATISNSWLQADPPEVYVTVNTSPIAPVDQFISSVIAKPKLFDNVVPETVPVSGVPVLDTLQSTDTPATAGTTRVLNLPGEFARVVVAFGKQASPAPDWRAWAGRTPAASSGVSHLEGRVESAAAPTAAPNTFMASRRDNFFSVMVILLGVIFPFYKGIVNF